MERGKNQRNQRQRRVQSLIEHGGKIETKDSRLVAVEEKMFEKSKQIDALRENILQCETEEMILKARDDLQRAHRELNAFWQRQTEIEQEIGICA